ncbi:MAG TPA: DUF1203 domain-containing protein [Hyphomicrobiaceae bacterium]|nr:DUF1203 domain-containing protein [Hyphomicrobiaceae bacterium]
MSIRFVALDSTVVAGYRAGGPDANGQTPERYIAPQDGLPCRHCLGLINKGEPFLVVGHRPFPSPQPYAEVGPIFLHADDCERGGGGEIPEFLASPHYIVRGYGKADRIVYGTGEVVRTGAIPEVASKLLERPDVAYVHVRSATNNCYHCRIERG